MKTVVVVPFLSTARVSTLSADEAVVALARAVFDHALPGMEWTLTGAFGEEQTRWVTLEIQGLGRSHKFEVRFTAPVSLSDLTGAVWSRARRARAAGVCPVTVGE